MPQYLKIAEKIYQNVKEKKGFTDDPMEDLNNLMIELRQEIKGTKLKLLYNYIDFAEILIKPLQESKIKLDLSLIPKSKNTQEFVLWLAGFIERITTGGQKKFPPIRAKITFPAYAYEETYPSQKKPVNNGEEIIEYFKKNQS
ncbi:hypothetical protein J771_0859 [Acinetobacter baumannii 25307_8]|uniref:hypothetical protein n=1 Tax=Acinetobacter baumannii TaxID=470 RepID=UPI000450F843|nr:hypothetical protein [Acinetobacter baumannii]EXH42214.1 hypothetical protein J651_2547 [Acinetobacter baumannii 1293320]EXR38264.1 hypothetical protein J668_2041 [Acinetobacter baumannii 1276470-86]EXR54286.1 hypothetical protein J667_1021 [Acinetobacter baumannii 1397513]EXS66610.1 hypothetical protein J764_1390 [Acinetobacter baumannii 25307_1]EXS86742.1 hypothetical protein J797_1636 [Acinetobacter baumannii 45002_4]